MPLGYDRTRLGEPCLLTSLPGVLPPIIDSDSDEAYLYG